MDIFLVKIINVLGHLRRMIPLLSHFLIEIVFQMGV